jgi:hypothetical protein
MRSAGQEGRREGDANSGLDSDVVEDRTLHATRTSAAARIQPVTSHSPGPMGGEGGFPPLRTVGGGKRGYDRARQSTTAVDGTDLLPDSRESVKDDSAVSSWHCGEQQAASVLCAMGRRTRGRWRDGRLAIVDGGLDESGSDDERDGETGCECGGHSSVE